MTPERRPTIRLGRKRYAEMLRSIIDQPGTAQQFVQRWGIGKTAVYRFVEALHGMRVLRVCAWHLEHHTPARPVYAYGDEPDALPPAIRPNGKPVKTPAAAPVTHERPAELVGFISLLRVLEWPLLASEAAAASGLDPQRMRKLLEHLRSLGLVHIVSWTQRPKGGEQSPRYAFGIDKRDMPRPAPSRKERNLRYRIRRKARAEAGSLTVALAANGFLYQQRA